MVAQSSDGSTTAPASQPWVSALFGSDGSRCSCSPWLTPAGFFLVFAAGAEALMVWVSFQHSLERLTQPVKLTEKPIAARCVFECEEE